jgi:hypothetical protein
MRKWETVLFYDDVSITEISTMSYKELQAWAALSSNKLKMKYGRGIK